MREEQKHDECHRQHDLYARVKTVHRTVARKKLTECNILQHQCVPSFRLQARSASIACATV